MRNFQLLKPQMFIVLSTGVMLLLLFWVTNEPRSKYPASQPPHSKKKLILMWSRVWGAFNGFDFSPCQYSNCIITMDRKQFNHSKAVIIPATNQIKSLDYYIRHRPKNQVWIFHKLESQISSLAGKPLRVLNGHINYTMTFLTESDIFSGYGEFRRRKAGKSNLVVKHPRNRTRLLAWLVSHCGTHSKREVYFAELSKHIQADRFGRCSPTTKCKGDCLGYISRNYKFYFSAENTLCKDYVTEKVYRNAFSYGLVPIVYGGANYSKLLPPKSYIDVKDFHSPKELASFLKTLAKNDTLYEEYFQWKENFEVYGDAISFGFCNLCKFLNRKIIPSKIHTNLETFWSRKDCISSKEYFKAVFKG